MIFLLHGDNQIASRKKLNFLIATARDEGVEVIRVDGLKAEFVDIIQALETPSFFSKKRLVVIEGLFSRVQSELKKKIIDYLKNVPAETDIVLWEKKGVPGTTTRWLTKSWKIELFKTPADVFKFLDSIAPRDSTKSLIYLDQSLKKDSPEMVFYMMIRRFRELMLAKELGKKGLKGAPWQITRIVSQSNKFTLNELVSTYRRLLQTDVDIKTGASLMSLSWHLDLLITSL